MNTYFTHTFANKTTNSKPRHIEKTSDSSRWPTSNPVGLRPLLLSWSWQSWQVLGWQNLGEETVVTTLLYWLLSRFTVTKMICANSEPSIWAFTQAYRLIYTNITCGKIWLQVTLRWPQCPWQSSISLAMRLLGLWVFLVGIKASRSCVIFIETLRYLLLSHGTCWTWNNHYGFWIISKKNQLFKQKILNPFQYLHLSNCHPNSPLPGAYRRRRWRFIGDRATSSRGSHRWTKPRWWTCNCTWRCLLRRSRSRIAPQSSRMER